MVVSGTCASGFAAVREEFERNFAERGEVGASVHVTVDGEAVVDLWGGIADPTTGRAWEQDTIVHVWSCTKGATALCAHILASRGDLDLNAPVTRYWPEFGKNGKDGVLVRHLLNHQAGLVALRDPLPPGALYDWNQMVERLAAEEPFWTPGTRTGYHGLTFGFLVGEVVRRVSGRPLDEFFAAEVAEPLALDLWLRVPERLRGLVAPTLPADPTAPGALVPSVYLAALGDPTSVPGLQLGNNGGYLVPGEADSAAARAAVIGAVGAVGTARGLAGMYRPLALGGAADGVRLVDADQVPVMAAVSSATSVDAVLGVPTRFALGFVKSIDNRHLAPNDREGLLMSEEAFGHSGMGGALGFADPKARMSFGYAMNRQGIGIGVNERGQSLVDATYRALGYRHSAGGGVWYA